MDHEARCAFVIAQAACANAVIAGMQANNQQCIAAGRLPPFGEDDFLAVCDNHLIGHNAVIEYLRGY